MALQLRYLLKNHRISNIFPSSSSQIWNNSSTEQSSGAEGDRGLFIQRDLDRFFTTKINNFSDHNHRETENVDAGQDSDTPTQEAGKIEGIYNLAEIDSYEGPTLPIFQKIENLSNKVQIIRKEHSRLCDEVKGITNSLLDSETITALQNLSTEHEVLKNKYHEECEVLKKKYLEECSERKKLYSEVIELKGNIRVFCICRPVKQDEIASGSTSVVGFDSSQENELQIICADSTRKQFKFDHVFRPEDDQEVVFLQTLPVVTSVLDGYNVCIFAYGQTGTGKTYTMDGTSENRGVNYRTLEELFRLTEKRGNIMRHELYVSMMEVYNEKIRDLLVENSNQPEKKLEIKQSSKGTQEVPGLIEARAYSTEEVWNLLKSGSKARSVGSTNANELSSRSHCLLRVTVVGENLVNGQRTRSHLWLVDLAGSERVNKIEVEGDRLKESQFINKSLSALGDVISALASKSSHIPYRNSNLTRMLQSSLGGDCKTLMFVQISPNVSDLRETLCSLNFASRVRGVEHGPACKQKDHGELLKYKQLVEKVKQDEKETKRLQDNVQALQLRLQSREHTRKTLQEKVRELEKQLAEERKIRVKTSTDKKPPLAPSNLRPPLTRITNFMPIPTPVVRPSPAASQNFQPKRRASFATLRPESNSNMGTPLQSSSLRSRTDRVMGRQSFVWDPHRMWITSRVSSPVQPSEATTVGHRSTRRRPWGDVVVPRGGDDGIGPWSKFKGSPPSQTSLWKPKLPTVVALHKKHFVWSPLKQKTMKNKRNA